MQMQGTPQSGRPAALFVSLTRSVCRSFPQGLSTDYRGWQKHQRRLPIDRNLIARIRSLITHVIFAGGNRCSNFFNASSCRPHSGRPTTSPPTVRRFCPLRLAGGAGRDSSQLASPNGFRPTNLARNYEAANQWKNQPDPQTRHTNTLSSRAPGHTETLCDSRMQASPWGQITAVAVLIQERNSGHTSPPGPHSPSCKHASYLHLKLVLFH